MEKAIKLLSDKREELARIAESLQADGTWQECLTHWCYVESLDYAIKILNEETVSEAEARSERN